MSTSSRPKVPDGLRDLMKDLTREILKEKPIDIYDFAANYFQTRLVQKEDYAVRDFESYTKQYDFSYIQNPKRYQLPVALVYSIIPEGLTNLIKDLIKAILREQPQNLCDFAVEYFRHLKTATQAVETKEISYKAYDNYFLNKERFLFTPFVKCTCGRTFSEGFGSSYQLDHLTTTHNVHRNDSSYKMESVTTRLEDTNNNHVRANQDKNYINSEKYINSIYVIQRYFRRYLKKTKINNLKNETTSNHSNTPKNLMNEETAAIIIQRTLKKVFGGGSKISEKPLAVQNNEIVSIVPQLQMSQNENDNVSEAASYTSASTALLSATESGRENSEISTSENIIRKTIMQTENKIGNEYKNILNILTGTEDTTTIDGNQEEEQIIVYNQELTESLENQNTEQNKVLLLKNDARDDDLNLRGTNKNLNSENVYQKEGNKTNIRGDIDDSFDNITSNDSKKYDQHQMETANNSSEFGYIQTELHKSNEEDLQQKDDDKISNQELNNEYGLEKSETPSMVQKSTEYTSKRVEDQEEEYHSEKQNIDFDKMYNSLSTESLIDETHTSILKLNQEITESCDEITRKTHTNCIDKDHTNEESLLIADVVKIEEDYIENTDANDKFKKLHMENEAVVIDGSMEELYVKTQTALGENEIVSISQSIADTGDFKNERVKNLHLKENVNEPETTLVLLELLDESQRNNITTPNEMQEVGGTVFIKRIENVYGNNVLGENENVNNSAKEIIKESAEFLLNSIPEKQKLSDLPINEKDIMIVSNDFQLESETMKQKYDNSKFSQDDILLKIVDLNKQAKHDRNEDGSDLPEKKLSKNYAKEFDKQENDLNIKFPKIIDDHKLEKKHDVIDEILLKLQHLPNKSIDIETNTDLSNNDSEMESNHRSNELNISSGNDITTLTEPAFTASESNPDTKKTTDDNQLTNNPEKYLNETEAKPSEQFHNRRESHNESPVADFENLTTKNKSSIYILKSQDELLNEKQSQNQVEHTLTELVQQKINPRANDLKEDINNPEQEMEVTHNSAKSNQLSETPTENAAETSNEHDLVQTENNLNNTDTDETNQNTNNTDKKTISDLDENANKSMPIEKPNNAKELDKINDDYIIKLRAETSKEHKNNKSISNEATIMEAKQLQPNNKSISTEATVTKAEQLKPNNHEDSDSHKQLYVKEKELDKPNDKPETSKDDKNNKSISNEATAMKAEQLESDNLEDSDSHKQVYVKEKELDKSKDKADTSKDDKNNKSISNEATAMKAEQLESDNLEDSDSHKQLYIKEKELDQPNDKPKTSKDGRNNKSIYNEATIIEAEQQQPDNQGESDSHKQLYVKEKELDKPNDKPVTSKDDRNNKSISNEATVIKSEQLQTDNQNESDSHKQLYVKEKELHKSKDKAETSKDDKNNKSISNEATAMKAEQLESDNLEDSDSHKQLYIKEKELDQPNDKPKTSKDGRNNKYIYNEATIIEAEQQQPDYQDESDSHNQLYVKEKELDQPNDKPETSKDDRNNKSISNEATIMEVEQLQPDNQDESDSHKQLYIKEKELDQPNDKPKTSKDGRNNKSIYNEATIIEAEQQQPDNQGESDSHKQLYVKEKELDKPNDKPVISKDDRNNKSISNEATVIKSEQLQTDNQDESDSHKQLYVKEKELHKSKDKAETSKDDKNNKSISNEATAMKAEQLESDNLEDSDSHKQLYIKEKELDQPNDKPKTSKDGRNNKYIYNEATIIEAEQQQPDYQDESDSHNQLYVKEKELDQPNDKPETSKDDRNNKSISNEATIMEVEQLQPDNQDESDSHKQLYIKEKELDQPNDKPKTSKDGRNNKSIYNEATIIEAEQQQPDNQGESDSHKQLYVKEKELDQPNDKPETSKDDRNNKSISNEGTVMKAEQLQPDNQEAPDSYTQLIVKEKELDKPSDKPETVKDDRNNKSISNEATIIKAEQLQADNQDESDSHKQLYVKEKELDQPNDKPETSKDDRNNKSISNKATVMKAEQLQPDNQGESDSHKQLYVKEKELDQPNDKPETSKDDRNNKSISNEGTVMKAEQLQPDNQEAPDSYTQLIVKEKELDKPSDKPETSKDDRNNKSISNEATIIEAEQLQADNQDESDSKKQLYMKMIELDKSYEKRDTSMDEKNNKSISNEPTVMKVDQLQPDNNKESNSKKQLSAIEKEQENSNIEEIPKLRTTSCSEAETSKDDKNNKSISIEPTVMKAEQLQLDDQKESNSNKQLCVKEKEHDNLNDEDISKSRTTSSSEAGTSNDDENNKYLYNKVTVMKAEQIKPDNNEESDFNKQSYVEEKEQDKSNDNAETTHDDKNNNYISNEVTIMKADQSYSQKESDSFKKLYVKEKERGKSSNADINKLKTISFSEVDTSQDGKYNKNNYIYNEAIIMKAKQQQPKNQKKSEDGQTDDQKESDSHNEMYTTKPANQEMASTSHDSNSFEIVQQEEQRSLPILDNSNINEELKIEAQSQEIDSKIEIRDTHDNKSILKESIEPTYTNIENTQKESQLKTQESKQQLNTSVQGDLSDFARLEIKKQGKINNTSIVKDEFEKDEQKISSTENGSNEDDGTEHEQIISLFSIDQLEKLNNRSLNSGKENPNPLQLNVQEFNNQMNTYNGNNLNESAGLISKKLNIQNNEHSASDLIECGVSKGEELTNLNESKIENEKLYPVHNEETARTKSDINESALQHQNEVVLNLTENAQIKPKSDNIKTLQNKTINAIPSDKLNVNDFQINITDAANPEAIKNKKTTYVVNKSALINKQPSDTNDQQLDFKHEYVVDYEDNLEEAKVVDIEKCNANTNNKKQDAINTQDPRESDDENLEIKDYVMVQNERNIDNLNDGIQTINVANFAKPSMLEQEKNDVNIPNTPEMQYVNENKIIDNNESNLDTKEHVKNNSETDIDDAVHRVLTERLKELRIQSEENILGNDQSDNNKNKVNVSDVNTNNKAVTNNNSDAGEESLIVAESEKYFLDNRGGQIEESFIDQYTKNNSATKIGVDQAENRELNIDINVENVVESENKNDQEITLHNIGNKSPETLIGNQNLTIGRTRNYNEGLIESISGQRFAETHLKSFWKEYQMNNEKPLDRYDCGGNEKVLKKKEPVLTATERRVLMANLEMINHSTEKIHENEYDLIETENNCINEVKHLSIVDSMVTEETSSIETSSNEKISESSKDSNSTYGDINHKNIERLPRYFHGSIPIVSKENLLEKRKSVKEPTSFTILFEKSSQLNKYGKSSSMKANTEDNSSETDQIITNKKLNLDNCPDVEPLLDSETPTKLFDDLNEFGYDETHDIDMEITYTIDEIIRLKTEQYSPKNSDEENEFHINEYSPKIIRLIAKNKSQPIADDNDENFIDVNEFSPSPESMLQTIIELSESEILRPDSKTKIFSTALLQPNNEDYLTNLEKISNSTSTSWTTGSKEGEDCSIVSDEFLEDENFHREKTESNTEAHGGIYKYTEGKISEDNQIYINEYENLVRQAPNPPNDDPFYEDLMHNAVNKIQRAYREYLRRKTKVSSENNEYSDEINNSKRSLMMAVCTIQRAFRSYQLRKNLLNRNNSATITHKAVHSKNKMAANVIQKAFRQYLDHKLKSNKEQDSNEILNKNSIDKPDNDTKEIKNENVGIFKSKIINDSSQLIENFSLQEVPKRFANLNAGSLSPNAIDTQKLFNESSIVIHNENFKSIKNENISILNNLIGEFMDSERHYSNAVDPQKEQRFSMVVAEPLITKPEVHSVRSSIDSSTPSKIDRNNEKCLCEKPINNVSIENQVNSDDNIDVIMETLNPTESNAIKTFIHNKNDLVENEFKENLHDNYNIKTNKNSENRSTEIEAIEIDNLIQNQIDVLEQTETGEFENDSVSHGIENNHNGLRSIESSQKLAAVIIQKNFRSHLQFKNKPHEFNLLSNDFEPTAPKEDDLNSCSLSTINRMSSYQTSEEKAARIIQKALRKFMNHKLELKLDNDDITSGQTRKWFVGDDPIIANGSLCGSPSEICFDETEAYIDLNDISQYSVDLCSNLDKRDANNLSRNSTAPVSNRSSSVDLINVKKTNLSEEIVSVVGACNNAVQLVQKIQKKGDSSVLLEIDGKSISPEFPEINLAPTKNVETNLTNQFINSEPQNSDVNQSKPFSQAPKEIPLKTTDGTGILTDFVDSQMEFSDSIIPYEKLEEPCIKKTVLQSLITTDSYDDAIIGEDFSTSSDMDNDTEDSLSMRTIRLHEPEEAIEKMKQRRDSTTIISKLDKHKDYNFDEPQVEPIDNLDTEEDGVVVYKLKREETRESSAQSEDDIVIGDDSKPLKLLEMIDFDTQFPAKGSLKRVYSIAGDIDAKSLLKSVTIDESIKYIEPPDFEVNSGSFYLDDVTSQNIRRNMMAYSLSEADSDYFDKNSNNLGISSLESKCQNYDDFNVSTALVDNGDTSTETESTIVSAVTKIQAGARGYLTRKRLGRTSITSDYKSMAQDDNSKASFGNAAISESLEHLVQEAAAKRIQKIYRKHYRQKLAEINQQNVSISPELTTSMENSLAQKRSIMLQRGDALRNDSTPDEGNSSSNGSDDQKAKIKITEESKAKYNIKQQTEVQSTDGSATSSKAKMTAAAVVRSNKIEENKKRWLALRQNSMPVQIDSEVLRVIPKHMRKKIKSAEGEKKRNCRRRVLKD